MLFPSPILLILPYCRHNSILSLLSLVSIAMSVYQLLYFVISVPPLFFIKPVDPRNSVALSPLEKYLPVMNVLLAFTVASCGLVKHYPWRGYDYIWLLPTISVSSTLLLRQWISESRNHINTLKNAKYILKGA